MRAFVDYYAAVAASIRGVLPNATVGPGNFAQFYQPGMACNRSIGGGCAGDGLNIIAPMLLGILVHLTHPTFPLPLPYSSCGAWSTSTPVYRRRQWAVRRT